MKFSITGDENSLDVSFTLDDGSVLSKHYNGEDHFSASKAKDDSSLMNVDVDTCAQYVNDLLNLKKSGHSADYPTAQFDYIDAEGNISNVNVDLTNLDSADSDCFTVHRDDGSYRKYRYDRIIDNAVKLSR